MRILIVNSCNNVADLSQYVFVKEQADALEAMGLTIDYFSLRGKGMLGYLSNFSPLIRKINEFNPDIIHAHYGLSGLLANLQRRVPVVTTYHGSDINNKKIFLFSRLSILLSVHNIFVSKKIKEKSYKSNYRNSIIPCGVDLTLFKPIDKKTARKSLGIDIDKRLILFAGSFKRYVKNFPLAKAAIALLPDFELLELSGYNRTQVAILLNAVDALLMTSFTEGSPQLIKEAMACNCPIVSVPVGDVPELIGDIEGCYISTYDANDIAEKLQKACKYEKTLNGQERILKLGLNNEMIASRLKEIYARILKVDNMKSDYGS